LKDVNHELIAEFIEPSESVYISLEFSEIAERVCDLALNKITENHPVDLEWGLRLSRELLRNYERLYFQGDDPTTVRPPNPKLNPNLLWQLAKSVPLTQFIVPIEGPSVVLPNGNIAFAREPDGLICILDMQQKTFFEPITGTLPRDPPVSVSCFLDRLYYSDGHLVLHCHPKHFGRAYGRSVYVWKVEGEEYDQAGFLYVKDLSRDRTDRTGVDLSTKDNAVSSDGKMYFLLGGHRDTMVIEEYEVATGNRLASSDIPMQQANPGRNIPTVEWLTVSNNHLLLFRWSEESGIYPATGCGLGIYSISRDSLLETSFLQYFEEDGGYLNNGSRPNQLDQWILFNQFSDDGNTNRKISIGSDGVLTPDPQRITYEGIRNEAKLLTSTSVFVEHPNEEGEIKLDENDIVTGKKVRTISTGVHRLEPGHSLASVHSNGKKSSAFSQHMLAATSMSFRPSSI